MKPDSWTTGSQVFRDYLEGIFPGDEELAAEVVELIRKHGALGVRQFIGQTIARHRKLAEGHGREEPEFARLLRRALFDNTFPPKLSGKRNATDATAELLEARRDALPHPEDCICLGRGWFSDLQQEPPSDARVMRVSLSGATTYYCPGSGVPTH